MAAEIIVTITGAVKHVDESSIQGFGTTDVQSTVYRLRFKTLRDAESWFALARQVSITGHIRTDALFGGVNLHTLEGVIDELKNSGALPSDYEHPSLRHR